MSQDLPIIEPRPAAASGLAARVGVRLFGEDGLSFRDVVDLINPLQHVPLLGNLYRKISGDLIDPAIRVAGGALFGGPLGAAFAAANVMLKQAVGSPPPPADEAVASAPRYESRGGWMVAASRSFAMPAAPAPGMIEPPEAEVAAAAPRRGGWLVQAAYAMADARQERERAGIDTRA